MPGIEERLSTYASTFEAAQQLEEVSAVAAAHLAAQAELRASACFRAVLARALALGNFLNWGSRLGQAAGFRLKNLPKLQVHPPMPAHALRHRCKQGGSCGQCRSRKSAQSHARMHADALPLPLPVSPLPAHFLSKLYLHGSWQFVAIWVC